MNNETHDIDGPPDFGHDLGMMLRQAGHGFEPDAQALAAGGLRRGRARLFRRRAGMLTGAVAVAAIALGAVQLSGAGGGSAPVASDPPRTGQEMVQALTVLLPEDLEVTSADADGPLSSSDPYVSLLADDGTGPVSIDFSMSPWQADDWPAERDCGQYAGEGGWTCEETELDDGSVLTLSGMDETGMDEARASHDTEDPDSALAYSGVIWDASLEVPTRWGPTEGIWQISVTLSSIEEHALDPGYVPPLDSGQLAEIARAPVWLDVMHLADAEHGAPEESMNGGRSDVPSADLRSVFRELAPEGMEITDDPETTEGSAALVIGSGPGAELVINAWEVGSFAMEDVGPSTPDCEPETVRDDGTRIFPCVTVYEETESEESYGGLYVDVYYPSGVSVDFMLTAESVESTPLSMEQLVEIAGAPQWEELLG